MEGVFRDVLRRALAGPLPGLDAQMRMAPRPRLGPYFRETSPEMTPAAALLLLYPHEGRWHLPLTVRGSSLRHHTGQIALPGGRVDPGESVEQTALREALEEVAIAPASVDLLGALTPVGIPVSRFLLHPLVGVSSERPAFVPAAGEVDRVIEVPLADLRSPDIVRWEERTRSRTPELMDVPYYAIAGECVWGATAMVLAEFLDLLARLDAVD